MKRAFLIFAVCLLSFSSIAQKKEKYTENDVKQFYRTIQGNYTGKLNDSITLRLYITPIWEREDDYFHWLYMEAVDENTKMVVEQKILEILPLSDIAFKVKVYNIDHSERFAGKWSNRNFFDGFGTGILRNKSTFSFMKTKDYEYQTGWNRRKNFTCFPSGSSIHFKFVQEDERCYVKCLLPQSSDFLGITFFKELTD